MKKILICLLVSLVFSFSLCGCEESTEEKAERLRKTTEQLGNQLSESEQMMKNFQRDRDNYKRTESKYKALR